ncbi:hypothetical protein HYW75_00690 [Candidatus Pacearchaeota archaeon]|nr:hypothetical protein [Candidatus Pacearchaeota archaeon]
MIDDFWKNWRNKTSIEKRAIKSVKSAIDFIINNVYKNDLISIYIKGSFVTRELRKKSDVDILPIVKNKKEMNRLKLIRDKNKDTLRPSEILPISYTELKQKNRSWGRADTMLRDLDHYKLVYGKRLLKTDYYIRPWDKMFKDEINMLKFKTLPLYKKGEYGFQQLIKQVFWICYSEQVLLGKNPPRTWKGLNKYIKRKNNIIHKAYYFRMYPTKDKKKITYFLTDLERYLKQF